LHGNRKKVPGSELVRQKKKGSVAWLRGCRRHSEKGEVIRALSSQVSGAKPDLGAKERKKKAITRTYKGQQSDEGKEDREYKKEENKSQKKKKPGLAASTKNKGCPTGGKKGYASGLVGWGMSTTLEKKNTYVEEGGMKGRLFPPRLWGSDTRQLGKKG